MNVCQIRIKAGKNYVFLSLSLSLFIFPLCRLTYFTNCVDAGINLKLNSHSRRPFYSSCKFPSEATHGRFCHSGILKYL